MLGRRKFVDDDEDGVVDRDPKSLSGGSMVCVRCVGVIGYARGFTVLMTRADCITPDGGNEAFKGNGEAVRTG